MATRFDDILGAIDSRLQPSPADKRRELTRGLMGLSAALLQAGAPRRGPRQGTLGGLGLGLLGFQQGLEASRSDMLNQRLQRLQSGAVVANAIAGLQNAGRTRQPSLTEIQKLQAALNDPATPEADKPALRARIAKINALRPPDQVNVRVQNTPEGAANKAFGEILGKTQGKVLGDIQKTGEDAKRRLSEIGLIREGLSAYEANGGNFGRLAELNVTASQFLNAVGLDAGEFGLTPESALPAAEFLRSKFAKGVLANIGTDKGGIPANTFSEKDRELATKMTAQLNDTGPGIRAKLLAEERASRIASQRQDRLEELRTTYEGQGKSQEIAARMALRQVRKEFRGLELFNPDERKEFRALLNTDRRQPLPAKTKRPISEMSSDELKALIRKR
jgi:hypothetical protein